MKITAHFFLLFFLVVNTVCAQSDTLLAQRIDSLLAKDKEDRLVLQQADKLNLNKTTRESVKKKIAITDDKNLPVVKSIFSKYGYPGYKLVAKKSSHNFNLLVQHQDKHPDFQDSVLVKMKTEVDKKNASAYDYAIMVDKLKINTNQPQVYGTQLQVNKDSTSYEPKPVMEPEKLNERRLGLGLSTIEEYIDMMNNGVFETPKKK